MEIWKPLIYKGQYFGDRFVISNKGNLKNIKTGTIYKLQTTSKGYKVIYVTLGKRHSGLLIRIHRAVAETFIPNPNNLPQVNHKDCNKSHNDVENLEWVTCKENIMHAESKNLINLFKSGYENHNCKLSENIVIEIRKSYKIGDKEFGLKPLARKYGVSRNTIRDVVRNKTWIN